MPEFRKCLTNPQALASRDKHTQTNKQTNKPTNMHWLGEIEALLKCSNMQPYIQASIPRPIVGPDFLCAT